MSGLTDLLDQVKQKVSEIEEEVRGASPLQARIDKDKVDLETYALHLGEQTAALEARSKDLDLKEDKLNQLKETLKAQQVELLKVKE